MMPEEKEQEYSAESLCDAIHSHLTGLGFSKNGKGYFVDGEITKQKIRDMHSDQHQTCLLYTSPSPRDRQKTRMPSSA